MRSRDITMRRAAWLTSQQAGSRARAGNMTAPVPPPRCSPSPAACGLPCPGGRAARVAHLHAAAVAPALSGVPQPVAVVVVVLVPTAQADGKGGLLLPAMRGREECAESRASRKSGALPTCSRAAPGDCLGAWCGRAPEAVSHAPGPPQRGAAPQTRRPPPCASPAAPPPPAAPRLDASIVVGVHPQRLQRAAPSKLLPRVRARLVPVGGLPQPPLGVEGGHLRGSIEVKLGLHAKGRRQGGEAVSWARHAGDGAAKLRKPGPDVKA